MALRGGGAHFGDGCPPMKPNDGSDVGKYKNYQGILATGGSKEGKPTSFIVHDILQEG